MPNEFLELLRTSDLNIAGLHVGSNISKIGRDLRCDNIANSLKHATNLGSFARKLKVTSNIFVKLKHEARLF